VLRVLGAAGAAFISPGFVSAQTSDGQEWPTRVVNFICPFVAGGATDTLSRLYCERMSAITGQQFIVQNRTGAGGTIGMNALAKSAPDGYTIGMLSNATHVFASALTAKMPFDPVRDFSVAAGLWEVPNVLVVHPDVPAKSVPELIALCKKNPGKYTFASAGSGTTTHLSAELFRLRGQVDINHVPYRGGAQANMDLMAGTVTMYFDNISGSLGNIASGKVRALAVTGPQRSPALPEVPAMAEFLPNFELSSWTAVGGPAGMPAAALKRLNDASHAVLRSPEITRRFAELGASVFLATGPEVLKRRAAQEADLLPKFRSMGILPA
jgi:tripartite-type tricarboxylate transporter receptor subunit TctC